MNTPKTHPQKPSNTADETPNPQRFSGAWETKRLGEIAHIKTGSKNNEDKDENGRYPLFVRSATVERINSYCYDGEAILVPGEGGIGSIFHYINGRFDCHQRVYMINRFTDDMCGRLVYYNMMLQFGSHAMKNTVKATVDSLRLPTFKNFSLSIPKDTDEQRAIAEVLSDVDGLLNALDALIAKKQAIKQAVMQQLLTGKTRLPGFSGTWETKRLGEIASFFKGSSLFTKTDMSLDGKKRCIHYGELFTTYGEYISQVLHGTDREEAFFLSVSNDVLMPASDVTPNGLATASCISESNVILGGDILVIRVPAETLNGVFLAYAIKINRSQIMQLVTGTTVYHLYGRDMANFSFTMPSIQEQNAIVDILSDMDAEIAALEQRRDKTLAIKQGMMQQLLTGRVRLSESRIIADDTD